MTSYGYEGRWDDRDESNLGKQLMVGPVVKMGNIGTE